MHQNRKRGLRVKGANDTSVHPAQLVKSHAYRQVILRCRNCTHATVCNPESSTNRGPILWRTDCSPDSWDRCNLLFPEVAIPSPSVSFSKPQHNRNGEVKTQTIVERRLRVKVACPRVHASRA